LSPSLDGTLEIGKIIRT